MFPGNRRRLRNAQNPAARDVTAASPTAEDVPAGARGGAGPPRLAPPTRAGRGGASAGPQVRRQVWQQVCGSTAALLPCPVRSAPTHLPLPALPAEPPPSADRPGSRAVRVTSAEPRSPTSQAGVTVSSPSGPTFCILNIPSPANVSNLLTCCLRCLSPIRSRINSALSLILSPEANLAQSALLISVSGMSL